MSDNALQEQIVDTPEQDGLDHTPEPSSRDREDAYEARARRMGWVAKEDFRGDGGVQWVDAETFVKRAEQSSDILVERNKALDRRLEQSEKRFQEYQNNSERQLKDMSGQLRELQETLVDFRGFAMSANERAYKKARQELEHEMRRAVSEADIDRFDAIKARVDELDQEAVQYVAKETKREEVAAPPAAPAAPAAPPEVEPPPEVKDWVGRNQWFVNPELAFMNQYAQRIHMQLMKEEPGLSLRENLDKVTDRVRRKFPEEFGINPRREDPGMTTSGGASTSRASNSRRKPGYDDLPPDAKAACDRYVRTIPGYTKEEYLKVFFAEEV